MKHLKVIASYSSVLLLMFACKKVDTRDPIDFSIAARMPSIDEPIPGVAYEIVERKDGVETGWTLTGETDAYGRASGSFKGIIKTNYVYYIYFNYSEIVVPSGITDVSINGPAYSVLSRSSPIGNNYKVRVLPYTSYHFKVENVHCFDENDKMRFKALNYDSDPYLRFENMPWGNYFEGCGVHVDYTNDHILAGHKVFQIEVTRNGEVTTYLDTFNLLPNMMNEVFIEY